MLAIVKKTKRELSVFLLASILFQFINPIVGLALTSGPIQPEYTSYESPDAKDIVSLVTGDFQYSLPVMEVPGSEGGFEIPLFYHSGIRNEEEASWVGLGWNINVGCIDRSVVGFPDDYRMGPQDPIRGTEPVHSEVYAPGGNGWSDNYLWYQEGWDSEKGYSGSINILNIYSSSWGGGEKTDYGVLGVHWGRKKTQVKLEETATGIMNLVSLYNAAGSAAATTAAKTTASTAAVAASATAAVGISLAKSYVSDVAFAAITGQSNTGASTKASLHVQTTKESNIRTSYKYWYQTGLNEMPYGALFLGYQGEPNGGINSGYPGNTTNYFFNVPFYYYQNSAWKDVFNLKVYKANANGWKYLNQDHYSAGDAYLASGDFNTTTPVHIAYDGYSVMAPGISGAIKPYRWDMGSISSPKKSTVDYFSSLINEFQRYPVRFKYLSDYSNYYTSHTASNNNGQSLGFSTSYQNDNKFYLSPSDPNFFDYVEPTREGFVKNAQGGKLYNGRNIEWFTWQDLNTIDMASPLGVQNRPKGKLSLYKSQVYKYRDYNGAIGAMCVTDLQGVTYHFALPLLNGKDYFENTTPSTGTYFKQSDVNYYASAFLLTGITGPDYVDVNGDNLINNQDYGYWVKFNYGYRPNTTWRFPYSSYEVSTQNGASTQSYQTGKSEQRYLNSVETRTHIALFTKSLRNDGYDASSATLTSCNQALQLDKILLYKKSDLTNLPTAIPNFTGCSIDGNGVVNCDFTDTPLMTSDVSTAVENLALKKVQLLYDYTLCKNTPNSNSTEKGKLTLKTLQFFGSNNAKLMPDYKFDYDGLSGANTGNNFYNTPQDAFGYPTSTVWNLNKITLPTGSTMNVVYQKDDFSSVSGVSVSSTGIAGGGCRVKETSVTDGTQSIKQVYIYNDPSGKSYGVIAKAPPKSSLYSTFNTSTYPIHSHFDYPTTGVMYSRVTMLTGKLTTETDYEDKMVYDFQTPLFSMIQETPTDIYAEDSWSYSVRHSHRQGNFHIIDNTASIGTLKAMAKYDKLGNLLHKTSITYASDIPSNLSNNIGKYTEGAFLFEHDAEQIVPTNGNPPFKNDKHRLLRTTKLRNPLVVKETVTESKGVKVVSSNDLWDFYTGMVTKSTEKVPSINKSATTVTVPAYTKYGEMGLKSIDPANKNMLAQPAYAYTYLNNDLTKVVSAEVQTWDKNWLYRELSSGKYTDIPNASTEKIYRKQSAYQWISPLLNSDGSFSGFSHYDFVNTNSANWVRTSTATRYDHYSHPLEARDINNNFSSAKMGYGNTLPISTVSLSNYNSSFHTSFEDLTGGWFGGEVALGANAFRITSEGTATPHTGNYLVKVPSGASLLGPVFYASTTATNNTGIEAGRTYRVSAWIHTSSDPNAKVFWYQEGNIANSVEKGLSDASSIVATVNNWSLVRFDVTLPSNYVSSGNHIRIGVKGSTTKASYFDDLRVHPIESAISANTYDNAGRVEYVLNGDNYFTRYVYNNKGQLTQVWQETPTKGVVMIKKYEQHYQGE